MTKTFILVTLADRQAFTFGDPLLTWVKENFPEVQTLDLDAYSDDYLVRRASMLLKESVKAVVCFQVKVPQLPLGAGFRVLEAILQKTEKGYVLLKGEHEQIQNILAGRPQVDFMKVEADDALEAELRKILSD